MGLIGKAVKGGIAAKVISEAKKPKNQQKAKSAFASLRSKVSGRKSKGTKGTTTTTRRGR